MQSDQIPPPPPQTTSGPILPTPNQPVIVTAQSPSPKKKLILASVAILTLIAGTITAVVLVRRQQRLAAEAWYCDQYTFYVTATGQVTTTLSANYPYPTESESGVVVKINGQNAGVFPVNSVPRGQTTVIGTVQVPTSGFTWQVTGQQSHCSNSGSHPPAPTATPSPHPTLPPSPSPTETIAPSFTPAPTLPLSLTPTATPSATPPPAPTQPPIGGEPTPPSPTGVPDPTATPIINRPTATPTPPQELPQSGTAETTWILSGTALLLIGLGFLLLAF